MEIDAWLLAALRRWPCWQRWSGRPAGARADGVHRFAFPLIVVFFAWDFYSSAQLLPSMIHLDYLLLLYAGISYRKKRDDLQISSSGCSS